MKQIKKRKSRMLIIILIVVLLLIAAIMIFLLFVSPGKPKISATINPSKNENSICEKQFLEIGGAKQGMFIVGKDKNNPVLFFVHGGPSFSEFFLVEKYPTGIENYFTVCYWEERGGGISYSPDVTIESMTLEQLASDAVEVTNYLRDRFKKDKIYIMAHSGGTAFAIQAVKKFPQLYHSYIGISQITRQAESEKRAYKFMIDQYSAKGNSKRVKEFKKYPILENDSFLLPFFNSVLRDKSMHELGIGTMHNMKSIFSGVFIPVWTCKAYTIKEKYKIWHSKFAFVNKSKLREQILETDFTALVSKLDIPVYFFSGKNDLTVNYDLSKEYFEKMDAPIKGFYTFYNSAHSPMYEESDKFLEIMIKDVVNQTTLLADTKKTPQ